MESLGLITRGSQAFHRSRPDDPDVDRRICVRHPIGAPVLPGGSSQPCLSLVLRTWPGRRYSRSLCVLPRLIGAFARAMSSVVCLSVWWLPVFGWLGRWRGLCGRCELIEADANRQRSIAGKHWNKERDLEEASRAVKDYLATLTTRPLGRRPRSSRSSSRRQIPPLNGPASGKAQPSLPMPTTI